MELWSRLSYAHVHTLTNELGVGCGQAQGEAVGVLLSLVPSSSVGLLCDSSTGNQGPHTQELPFAFASARCLPGFGSQGSPSGHNLLSMAASPTLTGLCCHLSRCSQKACLGAGARRKAY